jgi:type II secretory pathway pseudopilin PulG
MTLVETAIALLLLGAVLFLLAGSAKWTRQRAKDQLAWDLLAALNRSLAAYVQTQGDYPPGRADRQPDEAIAALLGDEFSARYILSLPPALHGGHKEKPTLVDPWARPLHYLTADCDDAGRVEANDGRPVFVLQDGRGSDDIAKGD